MPIPEIVNEGEREGWACLAITQLSGTPGSEAGPSLTEEQFEAGLTRAHAVRAAREAYADRRLAA